MEPLFCYSFATMDPVQEIKQRLSISEVVRDYATLKPGSGAGQFKAVCPFHDDHDPSLFINDRKGFAWCFACNTGGDIFNFVQKVENCSFPEALRLLAEKAGVKIENYTPPNPKAEEHKERIFRLLGAAADFFEGELYRHEKAQAILAKRKISEQVLLRFKIGFAPDSDQVLQRALLDQGFSRKEMESAGLIVADERNPGETRDKFRNRLMFPIWNSRGEICGFGGRYIGESEKAPKYLNSPETEVYRKSDILYGYHFAKDAIREQKFALLTEGYFDVLACVSEGFLNAVAVSGTAFTPAHAKLLARSAGVIALALDVDTAGQTAARRAAIVALQNRLQVEIVSIPGGKDPDEAVRENAEAFREAIKNRKPAMEVFFTRSFLHRDPNNLTDKKAISDELLPLIGAQPRAIEKDHYLSDLARRLGTRPEVLEKERTALELNADPIRPKPTGIARRLSTLEYLFGILFALPELFPECQKHLLEDLLPSEQKKFYKMLSDSYNVSGILMPDSVLASLPEPEAEKWRACAIFAEDALGTLPDTLRLKELHQTVQKINLALIPQKLNALSARLKDSPADSGEILNQMNELTRLLQKFHHQ